MSDSEKHSNKKWLIGCGAGSILLLGGIIAGVIHLKNMADSLLESARLEPSEYSQILKSDDFQPPEDGIIREEDLKSFLEIAQSMKQRIQDYFEKQGKPLDWVNSEVHLRLMSELYDIRKLHAELLREKQFSLRKYRWINRQLVIIFGGDRVKQMNLLIRAIQSDQPEIRALQELREIPQDNLDLFDRYEQEIEEVLQLWILGL